MFCFLGLGDIRVVEGAGSLGEKLADSGEVGVSDCAVDEEAGDPEVPVGVLDVDIVDGVVVEGATDPSKDFVGDGWVAGDDGGALAEPAVDEFVLTGVEDIEPNDFRDIGVIPKRAKPA